MLSSNTCTAFPNFTDDEMHIIMSNDPALEGTEEEWRMLLTNIAKQALQPAEELPF